jgi:hypothetical protein
MPWKFTGFDKIAKDWAKAEPEQYARCWEIQAKVEAAEREKRAYLHRLPDITAKNMDLPTLSRPIYQFLRQRGREKAWMSLRRMKRSDPRDDRPGTWCADCGEAGCKREGVI